MSVLNYPKADGSGTCSVTVAGNPADFNVPVHSVDSSGNAVWVEGLPATATAGSTVFDTVFPETNGVRDWSAYDDTKIPFNGVDYIAVQYDFNDNTNVMAPSDAFTAFNPNVDILWSKTLESDLTGLSNVKSASNTTAYGKRGFFYMPIDLETVITTNLDKQRVITTNPFGLPIGFGEYLAKKVQYMNGSNMGTVIGPYYLGKILTGDNNNQMNNWFNFANPTEMLYHSETELPMRWEDVVYRTPTQDTITELVYTFDEVVTSPHGYESELNNFDNTAILVNRFPLLEKLWLGKSISNNIFTNKPALIDIKTNTQYQDQSDIDMLYTQMGNLKDVTVVSGTWVVVNSAGLSINMAHPNILGLQAKGWTVSVV